MRRKLVVGLAVLNGLVSLLFLATPADTQILPKGIFNCCETDAGEEPYCCEDCCWFVSGCQGC